jgi:hypothetical protein
VNGVYAPSTKVNVMGEYELGSYDNPFTDISPTSLDRVKGRVRLKPRDNLSIVGVVLYRRIENSLSGGKFDHTNVTITASYDVSKVSLFGSYSRLDISNAIDTLKNGSFSFPSIYDSTLDMGRGGVRYAVTEMVRVGGSFNVYQNKGSFGLDWKMLDLFAEFIAREGYLVRATYQRNDYSQSAFDDNDYKANIFMLSVGYRF